jgi:hypothetical protein
LGQRANARDVRTELHSHSALGIILTQASTRRFPVAVAASFFRRVFAERAERINDGLRRANLLRCHITHQDELPAKNASEFDLPHESRTA